MANKLQYHYFELLKVSPVKLASGQQHKFAL